MDNLDQKIAELKQQNDSYQEDVPFGSGIKGILRRCGRKFTYWYVNAFGKNQNQYNRVNTEAIVALRNQIENLQMIQQENLRKLSQEGKIREEALQKQWNEEYSALEKEFATQKNLVEQANTSLNHCYRKHEMELRQHNNQLRSLKHRQETEGFMQCDVYESYEYIPLLEQQQAVKNAKSQEEMQEHLKRLQASFTTLSTAASDVRYPHRYKVAVFCLGFKENFGIEAIRNEAYALYEKLKKNGAYSVQMVSLEPNMKENDLEGEIHYISPAHVTPYLAESKYKLIIYCESTANILFTANRTLLLQPSLIWSSAQNPLRDISEEDLEELRHLNDFGVHRYCVQSRKAQEIMEEKGFHKPILSVPILSESCYDKKERSRIFTKEQFTVGFASAPMLDAHSENRGIPLLCKTVVECSDIHFRILWRKEDVTLPDVLKNASNCTILYGKYDMDAFYEEVDCMVIPYASLNFNHACSLSAVEAMQQGIPVAATPISGISEVITACGMGEVGEDLSSALMMIRDHYESYITSYRREKLEHALDTKWIVPMIEHMVETTIPTGTVTLSYWDRQLRENGKYLVKGRESMKQYYQQAEVAGQYNQTRFTAYPQNCFDLLERSSISVILKNIISKNPNIDYKILDIACGDGRILQENIKFADCTAMDSSAEMLKIVKERFKEQENHLDCIEGDFFDCSFENAFDIITTFRYIRHFTYEERIQLYKRIKNALKKNGYLIFDLPNIAFELRNKGRNGWDKYNIYDVFRSREQWMQELRENGFEPRILIPVGQGLYDGIDPAEAMTWTVAAQKIEK